MPKINLLPCGKRLEARRNGQVVAFVCSHPDCRRFKQRVQPEECGQCSSRVGSHKQEQKTMTDHKTHGRPRIFDDGTIAYPKRGWEPPPIPDGYQRKSNNLKSADAWIFLPVLGPCDYRTVGITYTACGAAKTTYRCQHNDCEVTASRCHSCTEQVNDV